MVHPDRTDPPRPAPADRHRGPRELVTFVIGHQDFCVGIEAVREIRGYTPPTALPHAPPFVRGVINLRGTILPIIDLAVRLGLSSGEASARSVIVVAEIGTQVVGLLVDAVSGIIAVAPETIQPTPLVGTDLAGRFVEGILAIDGRMISLLTLDSVPAQTESGTAGEGAAATRRRAA